MVCAALSLVAILILPRILLSRVVKEWDADKVQSIISQTLARPVKIDTVDVSLSWTGIEVRMPSMRVTAVDGSPFLNGGPTIIEVAAIPLLSGNVVIERVSLQKPEIWLEHFANGRWNFSDIPALKDMESVTNVKVFGGTMHLKDDRDIHPQAFRTTDWQDLSLSLNHRFGSLYWPFHVFFREAGANGAATLKIDGSGSGPLDKWEHDRYSLKVAAHELQPLQLSIFVGVLPEIYGKINLDCEGNGVGVQEFVGDANFKAIDLRISPPGLSPLRVKDLDTSSKVRITPEKVSWQNLSIHLGRTAFNSDGSLTKWNTALPQYDTRIHGSIDDLGELLRRIDAPWVVTGLKSLPESLSLKGDIEARGAISSAVKNEKFSALVTLKNTGFYLKKRGVEAKDINGEISFDQEGMQVHSVKGSFADSRFVISGKFVPDKEVDFKLNSPIIRIATIRTFLAAAKLGGFEEFIQNYHFAGKMDGAVRDLAARISGAPTKPKLNFNCQLDKLSFTNASGQTVLRIAGGDVRFDDKALVLSKVKGSLGSGRFEVDGMTSRTPDAPCKFFATSEDIDIAGLSKAMEVANFKVPWLDSRILSGQIGRGSVTLSGTFKRPDIKMRCEPKDLVYSPLGPSRPAHLRSGVMEFTGDQFRVDNLSVSAPTYQLYVSAIIDKSGRNPVLTKLQLKDSTVDVGELIAMATAKSNPVGIQQFVKKALDNLPIQNLKGKLQTNCSVALTGTQPLIQGNGTLQSLAFTSGSHNVVLTGGTFASGVDGQSLKLREITGTLDKSPFVARGRIFNIDPQFQSCRCHLDAQAQLVVEDFTRLFGDQANELLQLQAKRPLNVKGRIVSEGKNGSVDFTLEVPPDAGLCMGAKLTRIVQPANTPIKIWSVLSVDNSEIALSNGRVDLNGTVISFTSKSKGIFSNTATPNKRFAVEINIPDGSDISTLLVFAPGFNVAGALGDFRGRTGGTVRFAGSPEAPNLSANLKLSEVSVPRFKLARLSGALNMKPTSLLTDRSMPPLEMSFHGDNTVCSGVNLQNVNCSFIASSTPEDFFEMQIKDLTGLMGEGKLNLNGTYINNSTGDVALDVALKDVDLNSIYGQMLGLKNEAAGLLNLSLHANASTNVPKVRPTLSAQGDFQAKNGRLLQFSALEAKLEEARILEQGILGLSVGNLIAPLESKENGEFETLKGQFSVDRGILNIKEFDFRSEQVSLQAEGTVDLMSEDVRMTAAGSMPRMEADGKIAKVGSVLSIGGLVDLVAKGTALRTPDIPVIGGVSSSNSRTFAFQITANLSQPSTIARSITKSFHWTASRERARGGHKNHSFATSR
jgi:hypothetical protein